MRDLRFCLGRLRPGLCSVVVLVCAALPVGSASAQGAGFRVVPGVPDLELRFEDDGPRVCAPLGANPAEAEVDCWSARVDRAVSRRTSTLGSEPSLACVDSWEILAAGQGGCPSEAAQCVRPDVRFFQSSDARLPIDSNIQASWTEATALAREYTAFQVLRNAHALNPHRPSIAGLALSQGLLVLYGAHSFRAVERELERGGCATEHLLPYFELADRIIEEVGRSDVPAILETHPPLGREWARRFHRVQLAVIGAGPAIRSDGKWREDCEKAAALGHQVGRLDADVHVWCGYAYEQIGMAGSALEHWHLARRSPNHPEAASYADERLARSRDEAPSEDVLAGGGR